MEDKANGDQPSIDIPFKELPPNPWPVPVSSTQTAVNHIVAPNGRRMVFIKIDIPGASVVGWIFPENAQQLAKDIVFHATGLHVL